MLFILVIDRLDSDSESTLLRQPHHQTVDSYIEQGYEQHSC